MSEQRPQINALGKVITFYSYKGGTGRTMALANTACLLAQRQAANRCRGVLVIDWDLEAPGLHRFFRNSFKFASVDGTDAEVERRPGLIDLFMELDEASRKLGLTGKDQTEETVDHLLDEVELEKFVLETDRPCLSVLKAGRFDSGYASRVNCFQWEALHKRSPLLILSFAEHLSKRYDYVLIDSRTGLTDITGVSTMLMPEKLVIVFTPNRQSVFGVSDLIRRAAEYRNQSPDVRPLIVFPLASRIDISEPSLLEYWRYGFERRKDFPNYEDVMDFPGYQPLFERLFEEVYELQNCDLEPYFQEVQVQHVPYYAYGENIAALRQPSGDRLSLTVSYHKVVDWLVTRSVPWKPDADKKKESTGDEPEKTAEAAFQLLTFQQQAATRSLFTRLVRIADREEGGENTRQRVKLDELAPYERDILPELVKAHLINIREDGPKNEKTVEAAGEAVIRQWARLKNWIDSDREFLLWRQSLRARIAKTASDDERKGAGLLSGRALGMAKQYLDERGDDLNAPEKAHINNSIQFERALKKSQRNQKLFYAALVLLGVLIVLISWWQRHSSTTSTADAYLALGRSYAERGEFESAQKYYDQAIDLNDKLADAYYGRGIARYGAAAGRGDDPNLYNLAIQDFDEAIELNRAFAPAHNARGLAYQKLGTLDTAIVDFRNAIDLDPNLVEAYTNLGNGYRLKGDYQTALAVYQSALERKPEMAEAYNGRGVVYSQLGDHTKAIADYAKAIELKRDFADAYLHRGKSFGARGELDVAIADYNNAIIHDPKLVEAYFWRGNSYEEKAEYKRAIDDYMRAIEQKPDYVEAYVRLGDVYVKEDHADRAITNYGRAIELMPTYADAHFHLGLAYQRVGDHDRAIKAFSKAIELSPDYVEVYFQRGISFKEKGNKGNAVIDFQKAFDLTRDSEQQQMAKTQLRELGVVLRTPPSQANVGLHYENPEDTAVVEAIRAELNGKGFNSYIVRPTPETTSFSGSIKYFNLEDKENAGQVQRIVEELISRNSQLRVSLPPRFYSRFGRYKNVNLGEIEVWIPSLR